MALSSTSYTPKWKSGKTTVIRVPECLAGSLLDVARRIDESGSFRVKEDKEGFFINLLPTRSVPYRSTAPVNVSSVPQRSPFRYPGGKTWFVPYLRDWLRAKALIPKRLIEPFAGGGIVSLTAAFESLAKHVVFAELDRDVAAAWKVILNGESEWISKQIISFKLDIDKVKKILNSYPQTTRERAFQTILRNRVQRGGIMAEGAGLVKAGEDGKGLASRWYPQTLARRIREINHIKDRFTFIEGDGFAVLDEHKSDKDAVFFIDPPYTQAARRLYSKWEIDHRRLFSMMSRCKGDFLMTYDNTPAILALAQEFGFDSKPIAMKNTHHSKMTELLIGRNLDWLQTN